MSLRDGAMRKDTFEIHAALAGKERGWGTAFRLPRGRSSSFHVIRIAWVSFASRFRKSETNSGGDAEGEICWHSVQATSVKDRRGWEMRSWWRCRSRRFDIGRQAGRPTDEEFCHRWLYYLPSSRGAVDYLGGLASFATCHIGLPCDCRRSVARHLSGWCSENMREIKWPKIGREGVNSRPQTEFRGDGRVLFIPCHGLLIIRARSSGCTIKSSRFARDLCSLDQTHLSERRGGRTSPTYAPADTDPSIRRRAATTATAAQTCS